MPFYSFFKGIFTQKTTYYYQRKVVKKNMLIVVAKPEDEAEFFLPVIDYMKRFNHIYILAISNGSQDGNGKQKEKEFAASCKLLGIEDYAVYDEPDLQFGEKEFWESDRVADVITKHLTSRQGEGEIDFIITYDANGQTYHPNRMAVHRGISKVFEDRKFTLDVMTLRTVGKCKRYSAYFDCQNVMYDTMNYFKIFPNAAIKARGCYSTSNKSRNILKAIFCRYTYLNDLEHFTHTPEKYGEKKKEEVKQSDQKEIKE
ncbi:UNKNOWN [Stylonychia lemnae]|uniref:N-acetylglucosaminylphosphatidylinositol deacetylase n=1 Tax=Stylonychia lemnae TaxID=5949 RepID=A0A078B195_STYLE|nr:UNKNOWN [Stylonychia lemnae]|eukprot:CDW86903.1 UNKNOWN [Stylonychia lemnae]